MITEPNISSLARRTQIASLVTFILSLAMVQGLSAAPISYTSEYNGNVVPNATLGTIADPVWDEVSTGSGSIVSANGILQANSMNTTDSNYLFWMIGDNDGSLSGTSQAWNVTPSVGVTVDFNVQVTAAKSNGGGDSTQQGGFNIQVSDGQHGISFYFGLTSIIATGASSYTTAIPLDLSSSSNTFRITLQDGAATLYMNDLAAPIFSALDGTATLAGYNRVLFGDFTSVYSGSYNLDYVSWNNTVAEFSAPIPEPSAFMLLGGVCLLFGLRRFAFRRPA